MQAPCTFCRLHQRQGSDAGLGGGVGALPDAAPQAGAGRGVDDARINGMPRFLPRPPVICRVPADAKVAAQMHAQDGIPLVGRAGDKHAIAHEAGIVDHGMEVAEPVERSAHYTASSLIVGHVLIVGDRFAAGGPDFVDNLLGGRIGRSVSVRADAEIVDDDLGTLAGKA